MTESVINELPKERGRAHAVPPNIATRLARAGAIKRERRGVYYLVPRKGLNWDRFVASLIPLFTRTS